jgi:hypothetical protein
VIEFDRRDIARFRAVVRRCAAGCSHGSPPSVSFVASKDGLTMSAILEDTVLALRLAAPACGSTSLVVPFTVLAAIEGPGASKVTLDETERGRVRCRWIDKGENKELVSDVVPVDRQSQAIPPLGKLHPVHRDFLAALHACGQTASRQHKGRLALSRLQLRGSEGQVIGTDGTQLLIWGGFTFPFEDNVLVAAIPVFGSRELAKEPEVRIAGSREHIVVAAGAWTLWLTQDIVSRYPDVTAVLPRSTRLATLVLSEADATALLHDLQKDPVSNGEPLLLDLDFGPRPALRWPEGTPGRRAPYNLIRSQCQGPVTTVRLDPKYFVRALALGFREVQSTGPEDPVVCRDAARTYMVAQCRSATIKPAAGAPDPGPSPKPAPLTPPGDTPMPCHQNEPASAPKAAPEEISDPLLEADGLRLAVAEVSRRLARLILSLRQFQKQRRALQSAWTSLKKFRLGVQEELR